jgi:ribosomal protein L11 methyltransferase
MTASWAEVACEIPSDLVDQLAPQLVELSGSGVCIDNQALDTFSLEGIGDAPIMVVKAYFADGPNLERQVAEVGAILESLAAANPGFTPKSPVVSHVRQEEWATSWKQHFHVSRIGRRLILKPSWEEFAPQADDVVIELDPGMAFGTGTHPTTRLCLEALERIFDHSPPFSSPQLPLNPHVLDVGTGSGVLAIAARRLGAGRLVALDIDPEAVTVARENLAHNGVTDNIEISTIPVSRHEGGFAIVLANILAEDIAQMSSDLVSQLLPGGLLILSGILNEKERLVMDAFIGRAVTLTEATRQEEWSCLVYRRDW